MAGRSVSQNLFLGVAALCLVAVLGYALLAGGKQAGQPQVAPEAEVVEAPAPALPSQPVLNAPITSGVSAPIEEPLPLVEDTQSTATEEVDPEIGVALVEGIVYDPEGNPASGATVIIGRGEGEPRRRGRRNAELPGYLIDAELTTDDQGRFTIDREVRGLQLIRLRLQADAEKNWAAQEPEYFQLSPGDEKTELELHFQWGNSLEVLVVDSAQTPLAGRRIEAEFPGITDDTDDFETDDEGLAVIGPVSDGRAINSIRVNGGSEYHTARLEDIPLEKSPLTIELKKKTRVIIAAIDAETDEPVSHYGLTFYQRSLPDGNLRTRPIRIPLEQRIEDKEAQEQASNRGRRNWSPETTVQRSDGTVTTDALGLGAWEVVLRRLPSGNTGKAAFQIDGSLEELIVPVLMGGGSSVRGVARQGSEGGAVVPEANVLLSIANSRWGSSQNNYSAKADEAGKFEFPDVMPGEYRLTALAEGLAASDPVNIEITGFGDKLTQDVILEANATIFGQLTGEEEEAGKDVTIIVSHTAVSNSWGRGNSTAPRTKSDKDGFYRLENVPPGEVMLRLWRRESPRIARGERVTIEPGEERELNINLADFVEVSGQVLLNGAPAFPKIKDLRFYSEGTWSGNRDYNVLEDSVFKRELAPGKILAFSRDLVGATPHMEVPSEPFYQTQDILFETVDLEIQLIDETGGGGGPIETTRGSLQLRTLDERPSQRSTERVLGANFSIGEVIKNRYRITYTSEDGLFTAGPLEVDLALENQIILPLESTTPAQ